MPGAEADSPDETFFNDLSQQVPEPNGTRQSPPTNEAVEGHKDDSAAKAKRIACVLCRKRKLRCDGTRPTCGTCKRLAHDCAYDEVRKKSGPKRGYVKLLEARLQQVETLLKNQETSEPNRDTSRHDPTSAYVASTLQGGHPRPIDTTPSGLPSGQDTFPANVSANGQPGQGEYPWEMIGLGLDEPLPPQDVINDLNQVYFQKVHPSMPVIHKPRFLAAMNLAPHMRPPTCLRYIMWTLAASVSDKYDALQGHFYERARKYVQADEMRGHGESTITLAHCQAWTLLSTYEFKQMYFPRAWLSVGRAVRLAQMMQLHRLDGIGLDVKQCLPPPKDWTEREERRRTFWMAFCADRYASIGTGWPMSIDERDILTNFPSSEEAFEKSKPMPTITLEQAMRPGGASKIEPFGGIALTAALFGRNLLHLHRPGADDRDEDLNGGFWTRHREIENILLNTSLSLPDPLRLPTGLPDANVVFLNMCIHTSAICLHQAAIFKADKYRLPITVSNESKIRCVTAAAEIASIMKMISHVDLSAMNPFISFCVYVAARVFVQYLKTRPKDQQMKSSLQFLLRAMQALRRKNPLTESFLVQLDLDLETAGVQGVERTVPSNTSSSISNIQEMRHIGDRLQPGDPKLRQECVTIFHAGDTQASASASNGVANAGAAAQSSGTQYVGSTPGPPFHTANAPINLESQNATSFIRQQPEMILPCRDRPNNSSTYSSSYTVSDENEMDVVDEPSPATSNSQSKGGSSASATSYSPANQNDMHYQQYRPSPKNVAAQMPLPHTTTASDANFFSTPEEMFQTGIYNTGTSMNGDSLANGFLMGTDWDMSAMGTGMTPMSEGSWNQMLDNINLGWDPAGGPTHGPGR